MLPKYLPLYARQSSQTTPRLQPQLSFISPRQSEYAEIFVRKQSSHQKDVHARGLCVKDHFSLATNRVVLGVLSSTLKNLNRSNPSELRSRSKV